MTNLEMLGFAAVSINRTVVYKTDPITGVDYCRFVSCADRWDPLQNDGDALRLAVALRFRVDHLYQGGQCVMVGNGDTWALEFYNGDAVTATRLAIVRAAALLGGGQKASFK